MKFKKGINIIIGPNGAGKTSILEAIFFCLTGKTNIPASLKNLRRIGTDENLLLELSISSNNNEIQIKREYRNLLRSYIYQNNIKVAKSKHEVENFISNIYGININLFSNLMYSSEGEIYKFQNINERSDLIKFLENILGFSKLIEFGEITKNLNNFLTREKKKIKIKKKQLKELQLDSDTSYSDVNQQLNYSNDKMKEIRWDLKKNYTRQGELKSEIKLKKTILDSELEHFNKIKKILFELYGDGILNFDEIQIYEKRSFEDLNRLKKDITKKMDAIEAKDSILGSKKSDLKEIKNKLEIYKNLIQSSNITIDCPICERLLTEDQIGVLKNANKVKKEQLTVIINDLESKKTKNLEKIELLRKKFKKLNNLIEDIEKLKNLKDQYKASVLRNEIKKIEYTRKIIDKEILNLEQKEDNLNKKISKLNINLVKISDSMKIRKIENYDHNLNAADIGLFLGSIINYSINKIIRTYKMSLLEPIIIEMSNIWNEIFPGDNREISIDKNFSPFMKSGENIINYDLLSSGEKILLLVILKTLMIKYFSTVPYLILDEPIEHLDMENRNLIIDYLFKLIKDGLIEQLVITTYEESIVRKFIDFENVNIISLQTIEKYLSSEEEIIS